MLVRVFFSISLFGIIFLWSNVSYSEVLGIGCYGIVDEFDSDVDRVYLLYARTRVREGPGVRYGVCHEFVGKKGMPLVEISRVEDIQTSDDDEYWILVRDWKERLGWVHHSQVTERASSLVVLKSDKIGNEGGEVNLYKIPSRAGNVELSLSEGTTVILLSSCKEGWCQVRSDDGRRGWVEMVNLWR